MGDSLGPGRELVRGDHVVLRLFEAPSEDSRQDFEVSLQGIPFVFDSGGAFFSDFWRVHQERVPHRLR